MRQLSTFIAIIAAFLINLWANLAPPNGVTIGELSNTVFSEVLIIPANYAFAIWGLIYLSLIGLAIYQALPSQRHNIHFEQIGYLLVISSVAQIAWIFLFGYQLITLSLIAMLIVWLPLLIIYLRLGIAYRAVSRQNRWFIHYPISIYLAWISVATIINFAVTLYKLNWGGWGLNATTWTMIMLSIATMIAITANLLRNDTAFVLVILWALVAIAARHGDKLLVISTAGGLAIILLILLLLNMLRSEPG